jgi:CAAX prenyl protease-like protein
MQAEIDALGPWGHPAWLSLRFLGASAVVPLAEELAFRGYLQRRLISSSWSGVPLGRFTMLSFLGTALAFGALHPNWIAGTLAGGSFALATYASGRIADAVVAHATTNLLLCGWALMSGSWAYL